MIIGMYQRGIPIDLIIFADTGGERPETYEFIKLFNRVLVDNQLPMITTVNYQKRNGTPFTLEDDCLQQHGLPGVAYGRAKCASKFKIQPQERYCNNHDGCKAVWKRGAKINKYIGYDAGEQRRINENHARCATAIKREGLPLPGKSSCFFCPNNKKRRCAGTQFKKSKA
jgi:hypothetical protein